MSYLQSVETYGVPDSVYFRFWEELDEESRDEIFLVSADMEDLKKRRDVVEMNLREVSEAVSEETLQGIVDQLFELMEPIPSAMEAVRRTEGRQR